MKDFLGNTFEVGDEVVYMEPYYKSLKRGVVTKENPKMCEVNKTTRVYQGDVVKITEELHE